MYSMMPLSGAVDAAMVLHGPVTTMGALNVVTVAGEGGEADADVSGRTLNGDCAQILPLNHVA